MRNPVRDAYRSAAGVLKVCRQEQADFEQDRAIRAEAAEYEATIQGYEDDPTFGLRIKYHSRSGFLRVDTPARAREVCWGQTKFRKAERLSAIILSELFPAEDWVHNRRYEFLRYRAQQRGGTLLEPDGFSPGQRLAFEYQGPQHFKARSPSAADRRLLKTTLRRDAFKVQRCKQLGISLVIIRTQDLDPEGFLREINRALKDLRRPRILECQLT